MKLGRRTCHSSIGLVFFKLGLRPSFILNKKLCLFLDLEAEMLDLSLQHWTCLLEACMLKHCTCHSSIGLIIRRLSFNLGHIQASQPSQAARPASPAKPASQPASWGVGVSE